MTDANPRAGASSEGGNEHKDESISLNDYIEAERDLEDDARAVLGGSDVGTCTYNQVCSLWFPFLHKNVCFLNCGRYYYT